MLSACDEAGIRNVRLPVRSRRRTSSKSPEPLIDSECTIREHHARMTSTVRLSNANVGATSNGVQMDLLAARSLPDQLVQTVINLSPETLNQYADDSGALALRRLVPDHLRRDGAGGHAVPAGRLAALRGRRRRGPSRVADPARIDRALARRRGGAGRRRQLRDRLLRRPARLFAGRLLAAEQEAPAARPRVLRGIRRHHDHPGAVHPDRPDVRPVRRRHRQDELRRFAVFNVAGGTVWILLFLLAGWWFGGQRSFRRTSSS